MLSSIRIHLRSYTKLKRRELGGEYNHHCLALQVSRQNNVKPRNFHLLEVVFISYLELTLKRKYLDVFSSILNHSSNFL